MFVGSAAPATETEAAGAPAARPRCLVLPFPGTQAALHVDPGALLQVFVGHLGQAPEGHHVVL